MKLNISQFESSETKLYYLHIKKSDGSLDFADHHTEEELKAHDVKIKSWEENGKKGRKPALRKCKKPFRLIFKSLHSAAFRKAFLTASFKAGAVKESIKQGITKDHTETVDSFINKASDVAADAFLNEEDKWREIIMQTCCGWENLLDEEGDEIEFSTKVLNYVIYPMEHYHIFSQVKEALGSQLNFTEE